MERLIQLHVYFTLKLFLYKQGLDLRKYSKEIEQELNNLEKVSIKDCNYNCLYLSVKKNVFYLELIYNFLKITKKPVIWLSFTIK